MSRILIRHLPAYVGETVRISGWLHATRRLGGTNFILIRDRTGTVQVVASAAQLAPIRSLPLESVVAVDATVRADARATRAVELHDPVFSVLSAAAAPPTLDLTRPTIPASLPVQLDRAPLTLRHPRRQLAARLAAALVRGFRASLDSRDFVEVFTPKILGAASEGGANVFRLDYFGRDAFLAQSPQFYKQMLVGALERVYEVGPVFRAEPHDTARHLAQYTSLDVEMGFIDGPDDILALLTEVLTAMMSAATEAVPELNLPPVPNPVPTIHFQEAMALLSQAWGRSLETEPDLAPAHERWLGEWAEAETGSAWLVVMGYPLTHRPFYTQPDDTRPGYSRSFDVLLRGQEIVTGGQRLHRYEDYHRAIVSRGWSMDPFASYLEAFATGMPPHGGFAIGLERVAQQLLGAANVREAALFVRDLHRLAP